jgi:hypothetical protein
VIVFKAPAPATPVTAIPIVAHVAVAPVSATPKVVAPAPKVSRAPVVVARITVAPAATVRPVAVLAKAQPAAALSIFKPVLVLHAAPLPSSPPTLTKAAPKLVTTTGSVYENFEVERVMSDSIIISYTPVGGGWAMTKVDLSDLPAAFRQQYEKK